MILLDLVLPDVDGWAFLQRMKSSPATATIPIIMVSVVADRQQCRLFGVDLVLQKPVNRDELFEALSAAGVELAAGREGAKAGEP